MTFHFASSIIFLFSLLTGLFGQSLTAHARDVLLEGADSDILYDEGLHPAAVETAGIYREVRTTLEKTIGWEIDFKPGLVLIGNNDDFKIMAGNNLTVAYALPEKNIIVIDYSRMKTSPFNLESIVKHELCHLLLHDRIPDKNLPRWLDEGVAQWVSGGLADIVIEKRSVLTRAVLQNRIIGLKYLKEDFPDDEDMLAVAYAESRDLVEYIIHEKGAESILGILACLNAGEDIDEAVDSTLSVSLNELESKWYKSLEKKATWISVLINNLYEMLFFLAALALIFGFFRAWRRKRHYGDDEEDGVADNK